MPGCFCIDEVNAKRSFLLTKSIQSTAPRSCASKLARDSRLGSFCWRCVVLRELTLYGLENPEGFVALRDLDEVGSLPQGDVEFAPLHCAEFSDAVALHVEDADVVRAAVDALETELATVDSPADGGVKDSTTVTPSVSSVPEDGPSVALDDSEPAISALDENSGSSELLDSGST